VGFGTCGDRPSCTAEHVAMRLVSMEHGALTGSHCLAWGDRQWDGATLVDAAAKVQAEACFQEVSQGLRRRNTVPVPP